MPEARHESQGHGSSTGPASALERAAGSALGLLGSHLDLADQDCADKGEAASSICPFVPVESCLVAKVSIEERRRCGRVRTLHWASSGMYSIHTTNACQYIGNILACFSMY